MDGIDSMKILLILPFILAACSTPAIEPVEQVEVRTVEIQKPAPIVPTVDQLSLKPVNWIIITPDNVDEQFAKIEKGEIVLFALTTEGYENIALNLSDVRALIEQQNRIIAIYKSQF
jgi:hypothetical protein